MDLSSNITIPGSYIRKAQDVINTRNKIFENLFYHKKIPEQGWNEKLIEELLLELNLQHKTAVMKNFRWTNDIIVRRNYNCMHGSTLSLLKGTKYQETSIGKKVHQLANIFAAELINVMGIGKAFDCSLIPVATGMSLIFSMLTFRSLKPNAHYVIWSRIDQKSCFKSIISAGFIPIIIDTKWENNEYVTDIDGIKQKIQEIGAENLNCIISTTSCFAPRACDNIEMIAKICSENNIYHLINNAYGLSNRTIMKQIHKASLNGRIDVFLQSTDKNLCVPVGGAIIASFDSEIFSKFTEVCSETMSISAAIDVVITLLSMGKKKYIEIINSCEIMYKYLKCEMSRLADKYNEKIIDNPGNPISIAFTLTNVPKTSLTQVGSMLYTRNVSGVRVITANEVKVICDFKFERWGTHSSNYCVPYLTAAATIGITKSDIDIFIDKLDKVFTTLLNKEARK